MLAVKGENRVGRSLGGAWKVCGVRRVHRGEIATEILNYGLGEPEPRGASRVREVEDAFAVLDTEKLHDLLGEVESPGRLTPLIVHDGQRAVLPIETRDRADEVGAVCSVQPRAANDDRPLGMRGANQSKVASALLAGTRLFV